MKKSVLILSIIIHFSGLAYAQQVPDSLRKMRLKEVEIADRKRRFKTDSVSSLLRLEGSFVETPQHIVNVSSALIREQGGLVLRDIVRNASGVHMGYSSNLFDASTTIFMRGFPAPTFVNGLYQKSSVDDAAIIESVDFIKGPAGFLASSGEPGGSININTKTPKAQRVREIEISGGSFNLWRGAVDIGSAVKNKGFSYRLNAAYQYQQSFLDFIKTNKYVVAPVLQYNFSPKTYILGEYNLVRLNAKGGSSTTKVGTDEEIRNAKLSSNYGGDPGLPDSYGQTESARLMFTHAFHPQWKLILQTKYTRTPIESWLLMSENQSPVNFDSSNTTRRLPINIFQQSEVIATQAYVKGNFQTGAAVKHYLLAGADHNYTKDLYGYNTGEYSFPFDRNRPQYGLPTDSVKMVTNTPLSNEVNNWWSVFVYDMIQLGPRWRLNLGGRYTTTQQVGGAAAQAFSPRLGITWLIRDNISVYALYDQSFIPQPGQDFEKRSFKPLRGNDIEVGMKGEWWNKRLTTNVTVFRVIKNNLLASDLSHPRYRVQVGQATSTGVELDINGQLTDRWTVSANYAYTHAVTSKDTKPNNVGTSLAFMPQQIANAWIQYSVPIRDAGRLRFSLGESTVVKPATYTKDVYLPGYTKFDAGVAFDAGKWYVRVIADNITDKRYFSSGDILVGAIFPDVKTTYYIDGNPFNMRAFFGVRL